MVALTVSQTIFYIVASIGIIVLTVMLVMVIYYLLNILRNTRDVTEDIKQVYHKTKRKVGKIIKSIKN